MNAMSFYLLEASDYIYCESIFLAYLKYFLFFYFRDTLDGLRENYDSEKYSEFRGVKGNGLFKGIIEPKPN